jgi:uncharacterized glyoxalase superfamily protein PhnB
MSKMSEYGSIVPVFAVADIGTTLNWYQTKLGFWSNPFPATEPYVFAILFRDDIEIMLQRVTDYQKPDLYGTRDGGVWDAYIRTSNVKELYDGIKDEVTIIKPLRQQPYGNWEFEVRDPNGYVLVFSERG